jgi:uncharacterized protein involved in exopolysaccharide biosynthesis
MRRAFFGAPYAKPSIMTTSVEKLRQLRDEIRVKAHLAGMEAKAGWEALEPRLAALEEQLESTGATIATIADVVSEELGAALQRIRDRLGSSS